MAVLSMPMFTSCNGFLDRDGRNIISEVEYFITIASRKLPGVVTDNGNPVLTDVFAARVEDSDWFPLNPGSVRGFDYEEGYEYELLVKETQYLDYSVSDAAWSEIDLIKIVSKIEMESEELPTDFIPEWY